jgi:hypothetical protein
LLGSNPENVAIPFVQPLYLIWGTCSGNTTAIRAPVHSPITDVSQAAFPEPGIAMVFFDQAVIQGYGRAIYIPVDDCPDRINGRL